MKRTIRSLTGLALAVLSLTSCSQGEKHEADMLTMLIGTYTDGGSYGIYAFHFNQVTGDGELKDSLAMKNPSYLTLSADGQTVFAVSETNDEQASLNHIELNPQNGSMKLLSSVPTRGADPCYVATDGRLAITANYSGGSLSVFGIGKDGKSLVYDSLFAGATGGPDLSRQDTPHVHCAIFTPDSQYVLATDFSADRILSFRLTEGRVTDNGVAATVTPDSGPRHLVFSNNGRFAYLMSELSRKVTVFNYKDGHLEPLQEIISDSVGARGGADIHLSPDGRYLYTSNRLKAEGIAIFSVDAQTGLLTRIGYQPTAAHPRQFNITPNGLYLLCCCRDSDKIQVFRRDMQTGLLTDTHKDIFVSRAVCVQFHQYICAD